jgi:hypothetical protein
VPDREASQLEKLFPDGSLARTIQFRPAGIGYFGVDGKIDVLTRGQNPFSKDSIFMVRSGEDERTWKLAVYDQQPRLMELTDELFRQKLEQALL